MNGRVLASPYVCISSVYIETIGRTKGTVNLLIPPATDNAIPLHLHLARFIALLAVHCASSLRDVEQEEGSTRARVFDGRFSLAIEEDGRRTNAKLLKGLSLSLSLSLEGIIKKGL